MKHLAILILTLLAGIMAAGAQSMNVNHSGIQSTFDAGNVQSVDFSAGGTELNVRHAEGNLSLATSSVTSIECSDAAPDYFSKYADGQPAQVVFSCMEVNGTNPLQALNYRLEKSNKQLFDAVILFSSNINFSKKENVVYIHNNENVQAILNNSDKYIKPLKDRGVKVLLSILGNHDGSGLANMDATRCRGFAAAIADTLQKYDLDGVFFDDEWSEYDRDLASLGFEGFTNKAEAARAARMAYETKQAIGDKWLVIYKYGSFSSLGAVDGAKPGEYVDYVLTDYGVAGLWTTYERNYPGATKRQFGVGNVNVDGYLNQTALKRCRNDKYGAFMIYNLDQESGKFDSYYRPALESVARTLFDDTIVVNPTHYKKDWKPITELKEPNR